MASGETKSGYRFDSERLDQVERRFWREIWESAPAEAAAGRGLELHRVAPVQVTLARALPDASLPNLVLGAGRPGAVGSGALATALDRVADAGVAAKVPISPGDPDADAAAELLHSRGYEPGYAWMKFIRDAHPPRAADPGGVEVSAIQAGEQSPFGMIAATGFGLPAWAASLFAELPNRENWHCYLASVGAEPEACAAMLIEGDVAELGIAATLEPARGHGCQRALLHRRIRDAAAAGCQTLFIETGERIPGRPSASYRNILRAGFEEAYRRPNWSPASKTRRTD